MTIAKDMDVAKVYRELNRGLLHSQLHRHWENTVATTLLVHIRLKSANL